MQSRVHRLVRSIGRRANVWSRAFGVDPRLVARGLARLPSFARDARSFRRGSNRNVSVVLSPHLHDRGLSAGSADGHYFWQDLIVARWILEDNPARHIDIGSRIDGFISHLLVFRAVEVVDIRPLRSVDLSLVSRVDDATTLGSLPDQSLESISSLHAIEHFGLGRYGDPIDSSGHLKGMRAMQRVLAPGGRLYLSVPIGRPVVEFNGQRILDPRLAVAALSELRLQRFVAIPPSGHPVYDACPDDYLNADGWCGLFEFVRPVTASPSP